MGYILVTARIERKDPSELETVQAVTEAIKRVHDNEEDTRKFIDKYNEWSDYCQAYTTLLTNFKQNNEQPFRRRTLKLGVTFLLFMNLFQSLSAKNESFLYVCFALYLIPLVLYVLIDLTTEKFYAIDKASQDLLNASTTASKIVRIFDVNLNRTCKKLDIQGIIGDCQLNLIDDVFINETLTVQNVKRYIFSVKHCNSIAGFVLSAVFSFILHTNNVRLTFQVLAIVSSLLLLLIASVEILSVFMIGDEKRVSLSSIKFQTESFLSFFENSCNLRTALQEFDTPTVEFLKPLYNENAKLLNLCDTTLLLCLFLATLSDKLNSIVNSDFSELILLNLLKKFRWKEILNLSRQNSGPLKYKKCVVIQNEAGNTYCNSDLQSGVKSEAIHTDQNTRIVNCNSSNESMITNSTKENDKPLENNLEKTLEYVSPSFRNDDFIIKNTAEKNQVLNDELISNDKKKLENGFIKNVVNGSHKQKKTQNKKISGDINAKYHLQSEQAPPKKTVKTIQQLLAKEENPRRISPLQLLSVGKLSPVPNKSSSLNEKQDVNNSFFNQSVCKSDASKKLQVEHIPDEFPNEMGIINANKTYLHDERAVGLIEENQNMVLKLPSTNSCSTSILKQKNKKLRRQKNKKYSTVKSANSQDALTSEEEKQYFSSKNENAVDESNTSISTNSQCDSQSLHNASSSEPTFKMSKSNGLIVPLKTKDLQLPLISKNADMNVLQVNKSSPHSKKKLENLSKIKDDISSATLDDSKSKLKALLLSIEDTSKSNLIQKGNDVGSSAHRPKHLPSVKWRQTSEDDTNHQGKYSFMRRKMSKELLKRRGLLESDLNDDQNQFKYHEGNEECLPVSNDSLHVTNDSHSESGLLDPCAKANSLEFSSKNEQVNKKDRQPRRLFLHYPSRLDPSSKTNWETTGETSKDLLKSRTSASLPCTRTPESDSVMNKRAESEMKRRKKRTSRAKQSRDVFTSSGMDNESESSVLPLDTSEDENFHFHQGTGSDPSVEEGRYSKDSFHKNYYYEKPTGTRPIMWNDNLNASGGGSGGFLQQYPENDHSLQPLRYRLVYDNLSLDFVDDSQNVSVRFFCESGDEGEEIQVSSSKVGCTQTEVDDQQVVVDRGKTAFFDETVDVCCDKLPLNRSFEFNGTSLMMTVEKSTSSDYQTDYRDVDRKTDNQLLVAENGTGYCGDKKLYSNVGNVIDHTAVEITDVEKDDVYDDVSHNNFQNNNYNASAFNSYLRDDSNAFYQPEFDNTKDLQLNATENATNPNVMQNSLAHDNFRLCDGENVGHSNKIFSKEDGECCTGKNSTISSILRNPDFAVYMNDSSLIDDVGKIASMESLDKFEGEGYPPLTYRRIHDPGEGSKIKADFPNKFPDITHKFPTLLSESDLDTSSPEMHLQNNNQPHFDVIGCMESMHNQIPMARDDEDGGLAMNSMRYLCDSNFDENKSIAPSINAGKHDVYADNQSIFFHFSDMKNIKTSKFNQGTSSAGGEHAEDSIDNISGLMGNACNDVTSDSINQSPDGMKSFSFISEQNQCIATGDEIASTTERVNLKRDSEDSCDQAKKNSISVEPNNEPLCEKPLSKETFGPSSGIILSDSLCKYVSRNDLTSDLILHDETVKHKYFNTIGKESVIDDRCIPQNDVLNSNVQHDEIIGSNAQHDDVIDSNVQHDDVIDINVRHDDVIDINVRHDDVIDINVRQDVVIDSNVQYDDVIDSNTQQDGVIDSNAQRDNIIGSNAQQDVQNKEVKLNSEESELPLDFRLNAKPLHFEAGDLKLNFSPKTKSGAVKVEFRKKPGLKHLIFKSNKKKLSVKIGQNYYHSEPYSYHEEYDHGEPEF